MYKIEDIEYKRLLIQNSNMDNISENSMSEECTSDEDYASIFDELEQLEKQLHNTHITLHDSIKTLENIHRLIESGKNINVISGDKKCDFDEILEKLHATAMEKINTSKGRLDGEFGKELLKVIDECEFC